MRSAATHPLSVTGDTGRVGVTVSSASVAKTVGVAARALVRGGDGVALGAVVAVGAGVGPMSAGVRSGEVRGGTLGVGVTIGLGVGRGVTGVTLVGVAPGGGPAPGECGCSAITTATTATPAAVAAAAIRL